MHISPALVAYTLRWHQADIERSFPGIFEYDVEKPVEPLREVFGTVIYYTCVWAIPYYCLMFLLKDHLNREGYKTLFLTECGGPRMQQFSPSMRPIVYGFFHFLFVLFGAILSYVWWHNKFLNKLVLAFSYFTGVCNGARLYSDRYSHEPLPKLQSIVFAKSRREMRNKSI